MRSHTQRAREAGATALLAVAVVGLTGCNAGSSSGKQAHPSETTVTSSAAAPLGIVILTSVKLPTVTILDGSVVGGHPFCPAGKARDQHGDSTIGFVDRTITCADGTLRIGFDPQPPVDHTQSGPWRIISGTGAYAGWRGGGSMQAVYDKNDASDHPTSYRERYSGTVTRR